MSQKLTVSDGLSDRLLAHLGLHESQQITDGGQVGRTEVSDKGMGHQVCRAAALAGVLDQTRPDELVEFSGPAGRVVRGVYCGREIMLSQYRSTSM